MDIHFSSDQFLERQFKKSDILNFIYIKNNDQIINIYHNPDLNCFYLYGLNNDIEKIIIDDCFDMNNKNSYYNRIIRLRDNNKFKKNTKIKRLFEILFNNHSLITIENKN